MAIILDTVKTRKGAMCKNRNLAVSTIQKRAHRQKRKEDA